MNRCFKLPSNCLLLIAPALLMIGCGPTSDSPGDAPGDGGEAPAVEAVAAPAADIDAAEAGATEIEAVSPEEAAALIESNPDLVVLDVRRPDEFASGHIAGAVNVEYGADGFEAELSELDRDQPYLIHCRSGARSSASLPVFESLQFRKLYHLDSGFLGWEGAGLPVEE